MAQNFRCVTTTRKRPTRSAVICATQSTTGSYSHIQLNKVDYTCKFIILDQFACPKCFKCEKNN
ncbi:hypothetical protein K438DRAFT_2017528 [Mycena galopus ATCC 62051]|nr:hypothetical protein K438DRAFT_2017528 [Mycena galopus ATCC 62051]